MIARFSGVTWMILFCVAASALYLVKYRVMDVKEEVAQVQQEIVAEQQSIHLLNAEWAYLNRPQRLEQLARQYLSMEAISPSRIIQWEELPSAPETVAQVQGVAP